MIEFEIRYLEDKLQHTKACAAWAYGRWGVQKEDGSLDRALMRYSEGAQKGALPLTFIAVDKVTGLPIGMGSLWDNDGDEWSECTPWIASVFTLYRYRGQGVARALIARLEVEAKRLGFKEVFLKSGSAAGYYPALGYEALETIPVATCAAGKETLFRKNI